MVDKDNFPNSLNDLRTWVPLCPRQGVVSEFRIQEEIRKDAETEHKEATKDGINLNRDVDPNPTLYWAFIRYFFRCIRTFQEFSHDYEDRNSENVVVEQQEMAIEEEYILYRRYLLCL